MITRFAPTPSGFLHLGNAAHLRLLAMLADECGWTVALRIDDIDPMRTRPEYIADILDLVEWLEVPIAGEPRWQSRYADDYRAAMESLRDRGAYVCACSRTEWADWSGPGCPQGCRDLPLREGMSMLRMPLSGSDDIVIWRREGIPAYHLASIVDDSAMGITHVVRGEDLQESTRLQRRLAEHLPGNAFGTIHVIHHGLITGDSGEKLSKSAGVQGTPLTRTAQTRELIEQTALSLRQSLTTLPS